MYVVLAEKKITSDEKKRQMKNTSKKPGKEFKVSDMTRYSMFGTEHIVESPFLT